MSEIVTVRPRPGDVVGRVYHIECELKSDASCVELGAVVPATGKRYALHCWLDDSGAAEAAGAQQFVRLANRLDLFAQTGIVEVFGVGQTENLYFSVTEWLEGMSFQRYLERNGPMPEREAVSLLVPCLEGMAAAHGAQIVHGDLRPANIFICRSTRYEPERARLLKLERGSWPDRPNALPNPPRTAPAEWEYMAPEQLRGAPADIRSDVYAVGVILYVALAGRSPFSGVEAEELTAAVKAGRWLPLSQRVADLSPELERLIARAMHPDPTQRFRNMGELLSQLPRNPVHALSASQAALAPRYTWIQPAGTSELTSQLEPQEYEHEHAGVSRPLQVAAALCIGLMCAALSLRLIRDPMPGQRASRTAIPAASDQTSALGRLVAANPLPRPKGQEALGSAAGRLVPPGLETGSARETPQTSGATAPDATSRGARRPIATTPSRAATAQPAAMPAPASSALQGRSEGERSASADLAPTAPVKVNPQESLDRMRLE